MIFDRAADGRGLGLAKLFARADALKPEVELGVDLGLLVREEADLLKQGEAVLHDAVPFVTPEFH